MNRKIIITSLSLVAGLAAAPSFAQTTTPMTSPTGIIYSTPTTATDVRSSDLVGKSVYNTANERIGEIDEIIIGSDGRVAAAIVGVGGFLGIGERKVALSYPTLQMTRDTNGALRPVINATRDILKDAPEFKMMRTN